jgi:hypothetical protein
MTGKRICDTAETHETMEKPIAELKQMSDSVLTRWILINHLHESHRPVPDGVHLMCVYLTGMHLVSMYPTGIYLICGYLMSVHFMGVCLISVYLRRLSHGRIPHRRMSHRRVPHERASHRRVACIS